MPIPEITGAERRQLRAHGQLLPDNVTIGHQGLTPALQKEITGLFARYELIKVRATETDRKARKALFEETAAQNESVLVSTVGRTALLYRPLPKPAEKA